MLILFIFVANTIRAVANPSVMARIEVGKDENILLCHVEVQDKINSELRKLRFKYVTVDLEGYQTGNMLLTLDKSKQLFKAMLV